MTDKDKPVDETTPTVKPEVEETPVETQAEEPVAQTPASSPAPTGAATPVGTDQQGRQLYEVKCSDCGKSTQVPFNPSGDRPVYCRDCYMKRKG
jgi:CxxC-x17-CxxC domain-containing protein